MLHVSVVLTVLKRLNTCLPSVSTNENVAYIDKNNKILGG
jgi:hypothetical protein